MKRKTRVPFLAACVAAHLGAAASVALAQTATVQPTLPAQSGIWITQSELLARPMSGTAWNALLSAANKSCTTPDLSNQDDMANVCVMAKALVFARTGNATYRAPVLTALRSVINSGTYYGRA